MSPPKSALRAASGSAATMQLGPTKRLSPMRAHQRNLHANGADNSNTSDDDDGSSSIHQTIGRAHKACLAQPDGSVRLHETQLRMLLLLLLVRRSFYWPVLGWHVFIAASIKAAQPSLASPRNEQDANNAHCRTITYTRRPRVAQTNCVCLTLH